MIASFGGVHAAPQLERKSERRAKSFSVHARPLNMENYWVDSHHSIRRLKRKRERREISARQWKIQQKAERRAAAKV